MYRTRYLEQKIAHCAKSFGAVVVTGPRQSGKTALLTHVGRRIFGEALRVVSFDTPSEIDAFRRDPNLFFANHPGVLLLDEVQHVPDVFPYLKREIDRAPDRFRFLLSGSHSFQLMRGVTESLAGRAALLDLWPFCLQEAYGCADAGSAADTIALLEHPESLNALSGRVYPANDTDDVLPALLKGGYPKVLVHGAGEEWLESYRRTYIQRDLRDISAINDLGKFDRFLVLCAGRSGQILNKADLSGPVGVDNKTIDNWISILELSYQITVLPPYFANSAKRLVKRPKLFFADSGLSLHLQGIRDARALTGAPHFGSIFESFVVMEIRKLYGHAGAAWPGHFWGTPRGAECDLVLRVGASLVPIEIKHSAAVRPEDLAGLREFMRAYPAQAPLGILLSMHERVEQVAPGVWNFPIGALLRGVERK